jgi:purine-nucleoside phosphorylase
LSPVHIRAAPEDVAPLALLVGDPARTTLIAQRLDDVHCYNQFRGLLGYTGSYHGLRVSAQTTGMGAPSAAIVAEELSQLGVKAIVRLGTCGAVQPYIEPGDLVIATASCPLEGTTRQYTGEPYAPAATFEVVRALVDAAATLAVRYHAGLIATEDALYSVDEGWTERWAARGVLAQEMEASALFTVAALRGMMAGCVLAVSNAAGHHQRLADDELLPAIERMIEVALAAAPAISALV